MRTETGLKERVIRLRQQGRSYGEIFKETNIPKSTLNYWLKEVELNSEQKARLYSKQINILSRGSKSQKERRMKVVNKIIEDSRLEIKLPLNDDYYKLIGVALYWAEGSKSKTMQITNSDPYLILFFVRWLKKVFNLEPFVLKASLNLYLQQNEGSIKQFWSNLTGIPVKNFGKTYFKPESKGYKKNNLYYGTLRLYVPKSTDMKYKMAGWLQALLENLQIDVKLLQQRWTKLGKTKRAVNLKI